MTIDNTASSLICFKNGYSYVNIPVELENEEKGDIKECNVGPLPSFAVHGTVGLEADNPEDVKILSIAQAREKKPELEIPTGTDVSWAGFLKANIGNAVKITVMEAARHGPANIKHVEGTVKFIQDEQQEPRLAMLLTPDTLGGKGSVLVDTSKITLIETSLFGVPEEEKIKSLMVRYKSKSSSGELPKATLSYLTKGLTWAPSYTLLLNKSSKTMKLEGKACLLCDLPFFNGDAVPDISLVSGQPKIEYLNLSDPLASGESARNFIDQLGYGMGYGGSPRMARMAAAPPMMMARNEMMSYEADEMEEGIKGGETVEDFYHYKLENVPLKHRQPVSMNFIKACPNVEYEDIYYLDLNQKMTVYRSTEDSEEELEAIHAISFKNVSEQPLTSAPVSVLAKKASEDWRSEDGDTINENNFMVQGMMKFTQVGKSATVEITKAMDVNGKFLVETNPERKTELVTDGPGGFGSFFSAGPKKKYADSIEKNGKVLVINSKDEEINCKIEYLLYGHLTTSNPEPIEKTERRHNSHGLNPTTKYVWQIKVPARNTAELTFKYCIKEWNTTDEK